MKKRLHIASITFISIFIAFGASYAQQNTQLQGYKPVDKKLYDTIIYQDSILFNAFNERNFEKFKSFFDTGLEIYQDNTGLRNYDQSMQAFEGLFKMDYILKRQLIKPGVEVYPVKEYGAIQTGQHQFCHTENGKQDCGTFKFVHIWQNRDGVWKITKIITYDHKM